ncbi:hypothetical protein B296_00000423, partial [Ensete ventricosum]
LETRFHPFDSMKDHRSVSVRVGYLPRGMAQSKSDLELKPLWFSKNHVTKQDNDQSHRNLLAMTVGIKQKLTVDAIVRKVLLQVWFILYILSDYLLIIDLLFLRWVEGMAPVFSRSAWHCAWHLIQNDLIHGWGMDMKLGYCAQVDLLY